jgi:hypothetical protein
VRFSCAASRLKLQGVILYSEQEPNKKAFHFIDFTRKRESEKLVEGISSFEIAAEGEKYLYETLSNQFVISKVAEKPDQQKKETLKIANIEIKLIQF